MWWQKGNYDATGAEIGTTVSACRILMSDNREFCSLGLSLCNIPGQMQPTWFLWTKKYSSEILHWHTLNKYRMQFYDLKCQLQYKEKNSTPKFHDNICLNPSNVNSPGAKIGAPCYAHRLGHFCMCIAIMHNCWWPKLHCYSVLHLLYEMLNAIIHIYMCTLTFKPMVSICLVLTAYIVYDKQPSLWMIHNI